MSVHKLKPRTDTPAEVAPVPEYAPTSREATALRSYEERRKKSKPLPRVKADTATNVSVDHPDDATGFELMMEAFGSSNPDFAKGLLSQACNASFKGETVDLQSSNFALSVIAGIEPRDQIEAMLAAQMATVHMATMTFARRLANVTTIPQQDSAQNAFNKLSRTFAMQVDTLKRYRSTGEQKVTVQHVNVGDGGQAIVGDVYRGGEGQ